VRVVHPTERILRCSIHWTLSGWQCASGGLPVGLDAFGGIGVEQIFLLGVDRVSRGSIQPILAIEMS